MWMRFLPMDTISVEMLLFGIATTLLAWIAVSAGKSLLGCSWTLFPYHADKKCRKGGFPPGPWAWPIVGNMHLLANLPHHVIRELSRKYGPIVGLRFGQQPAIAVCSPSLAKEVLKTNDSVFGNRPAFELYDHILYPGDSGVIFTTLSSVWRMHRKICVMSLFTPKRLQQMENIRLEEISNLLGSALAESEQGQRPVKIGRCVGRMNARLIMKLVQSEACSSSGGEDLPELIKLVEQEVTFPGIGAFIPALSWLDLWRIRRARALHRRVDAVLSTMIAKRMKCMRESKQSYDDLLQSLLDRLIQSNGTTDPSLSEESLTMDEVKGIMLEVIGAAIHTTALTTEWGIAELLKHPHCITRLRQEMEEVLGDKKGQLIVEADIAKLTYLQCVIKEILRLHPVVSLLLPRMSSQECEVGGYTIPAKTLTFVNVWAIGRDEDVWENALEFRPERFESNKDIDVKGHHYELLPFGSGRRICAGLPVALSMVSLTLANLVHCFDLELPHGQTPDSMNMEERKGIAANKAVPTVLVPKPRFSMNFCSQA
ncbi:hypothetical protein KP509_39G032800 [Ceratopteris richardii]|uniref:Cytochrome P450 n=1 Tax=Ceratopteris richardii TaxID=49495 RepID=A0A8T2PZI7_CERRI|nr:hypothetical protein KP509_39G032800 [Ceratopteris richardii]